MKNSIVFLLIFLVSANCTKKNSEEIVYSAQEIEIEYFSEIKQGAWIQIDDIHFQHLLIDTTGMLYNDKYDPIKGYTSNPDGGFGNGNLPPSTIFEPIGNRWFPKQINNSQMAFYFISVLNQQLKKRNRNEEYSIISGQMALFQGKIILKKNNGKLKLKTSSDYQAYISVLKE
jgi:hypothetical protein